MHPDQWKHGIVRILTADGATAGTGFLASAQGLIATCAHVVAAAGAGPGGTVNVSFRGEPGRMAAQVIPESWLPENEGDVAVLRLSGLPPERAVSLRLGSSERCDGRAFQTYGYPAWNPADGVPGAGEVVGDGARGGRRVLGVRSQEITRGFSGAPAWDPERRWVIGVINEITVPDEYGRNVQTAFVTPSEALREACGELEVVTLADAVFRQWSRRVQDERARVFAPQVDNSPGLLDPPLRAELDRFLQEPGWHVRMEGRLRAMREQAEDFSELSWLARALHIDCGGSYEGIVAAVGELMARQPGDAVHAVVTRLEREAEAEGPGQGLARLRLPRARELASRLSGLRRLLEEPDRIRFERCYLVLGSTGAGKTHFVSSLLGRGASWGGTLDHPVLPLPLSTFYRDEPLAELVLQGAAQASGIRWDDLAALDRFLGDEAGGARVVVVLDDLQKWLAARPDFLDDLVDTVSSHTHLHSLYWLLLLEHTTYPEVAGRGPFWARYGPESDTGWVMLDEVNRTRRVGIEMLRRAWDADAIETEWLDEHEAVARYLTVPFVARVAIDLKLGPAEVATLHFVDFVQAFWQTRRSAFDYDLLAAHGADRARAEVVVNNALVSIVQHLAETGDFSPDAARLAARVTADEPGLAAEAARAALRVLARANLLRLERVGGGAAGELTRLGERVLIHFEMFWEYHMALHLKAGAGSAGGREAARRRLEEWFRAVESHQVKDGVFEFLLLLTDRAGAGEVEAGAVRELVQAALETNEPPASAVWFAGPRASEALQRDLAGRVSAYALAADAPRSLFALMYFLVEVRPELLDLRSRLALLQPHYGAMRDASLSRYFLFAVRRLFGAAGDNAAIAAALPGLSGCEVLGISPQLALLTAEILLENADVGVRDPDAEGWSDDEWQAEEARALGLLGQVLGYLEACGPGVDAEYARLRALPGEQRNLFRESLLFFLLRGLADAYGVAAYGLLDRFGWYRPDPRRIHRRIAVEMQRQANITLGNEYMDMGPEERARFEELIQRLVSGGDRREREIAFYLIRHTRVTGGRTAGRSGRRARPAAGARFRSRCRWRRGDGVME
ncbi:MAG TPA: trypsin-like peptidase domain-containing protein [Longimicrobium sp.]|nr:trypsin-like peptidase domain-containing protein [Longimicrobium sp.]